MHLFLFLCSNSHFGGINMSGNFLFSVSVDQASIFRKARERTSWTTGHHHCSNPSGLYTHCPRNLCVHRLKLTHLNMCQNFHLVISSLGYITSSPGLTPKGLGQTVAVSHSITIYLIYISLSSYYFQHIKNHVIKQPKMSRQVYSHLDSLLYWVKFQLYTQTTSLL